MEDNLKLSKERFIELTMRKEDIENNIKDKERAYQFMRKKKIKEIEEKNRKIERIINKKMDIYEQRRKMNLEMEKNKEILLDKFHKIMNNKKNKNKNQIMKELFNEDLEYIDRQTDKIGNYNKVLKKIRKIEKDDRKL